MACSSPFWRRKCGNMRKKKFLNCNLFRPSPSMTRDTQSCAKFCYFGVIYRITVPLFYGFCQYKKIFVFVCYFFF